MPDGFYFALLLGRLRKRLILELHEMVRVLHVVARPVNLNLLRDGSRQEGMLKLMKNALF